MSITTSQQISKYYELYRNIDITFTKEVIKASGLVTQQVFLKCMGEQWPCVIYSTSFNGAKIIAAVKPPLFDKIRKANNLVSIRYSFRELGKNDPLTFFIAGKVQGFSPYNQGAGDLQFITVTFTQRPPDPLIEILGRLLEANINSAKRRDERIVLTPDSQRKLCLLSRETVIFVEGVPRKCILRDLSFSGAKIIIVGVAKFLLDKSAVLRLDMEEPRETYDIKGTILRAEDVEGRKDLTAIAMRYDDGSVPMGYKMHINEYLTQARKSIFTLNGPDPDEKPGSAATAAAAPAESAPAAPKSAAPAQPRA